MVQAVQRKRERFPPDFMFQLTLAELGKLKSQFVISSWGGARRSTLDQGWVTPVFGILGPGLWALLGQNGFMLFDVDQDRKRAKHVLDPKRWHLRYANSRTFEGDSRMPEETQHIKLRLTCPPCGEVFTADSEESLVAMAVDHARKLHDIDLLEQYRPDEFREMVRRENETYWARIAHLIPDEKVKTVLDEKLCDREREIVSYVVHGFPNREIAERLCISERTVSTHLVNI